MDFFLEQHIDLKYHIIITVYYVSENKTWWFRKIAVIKSTLQYFVYNEGLVESQELYSKKSEQKLHGSKGKE